NLYLQRATAAYVEDGNPLDRPVDCVIAIDRSGSMLQTLPDGVTSKIALAREAATVFLDALHHDGRHRVALTRFGAAVEPFTPASTLTDLDSGSVGGLAAQINSIDATGPLGNATCYGLGLADAFAKVTSATAPHPRQMVVFL